METGNKKGAILEISIALKNITSVLDLLLDGELQLDADQTRKGLETIRGYTNLTSERLNALALDQSGEIGTSSIQNALLTQSSKRNDRIAFMSS